MTPTVHASTAEGIATLTLSRPKAMNAITVEMAGALVCQLTHQDADPAVRAIVLTGAGERAFSAGVDLGELSEQTADTVGDWFTAIAAIYRQVLATETPVVAAIDGVAAGGGFQIGLCSDYRLATPRSRIGQPEINAGMPSIMGSYLMDHCVGRTVNQDLSLTGRLVPGEEAQRLGLVNRIVPPDRLPGEARGIGIALASKPVGGFRATKARFRRRLMDGFDAALAEAIAAQRAAFQRGEVQAALASFRARKT